MSARGQSDLDILAKRLARVLNDIAPRLPIEPDAIDLVMLAEICWALDVAPTVLFEQTIACGETRVDLDDKP